MPYAKSNLELCNVSAVTSYICNCVCGYANYDSFLPYFYNFDTKCGFNITKRVYDTRFMTWFINRFALYLNTYNQSGTFLQQFPITDNPTFDLLRLRPCPNDQLGLLDLLCLENCWEDATYGIKVTEIFNEIITNSIIRTFVMGFIAQLYTQVKVVAAQCAEGECENNFTTYDSYLIVVLSGLRAVEELMILNYDVKFSYYNTLYLTSFAAIPYQSLPPQAAVVGPPAFPAVTTITNKTAFLVIPQDSVILPVIIDLS